MSADTELSFYSVLKNALLASGYFKTVRLWNDDVNQEAQGKIQAINLPAAFIDLGEPERQHYLRHAQRVSGEVTIYTAIKYTDQDEEKLFTMASEVREALHQLQASTISLEMGRSRFVTGFDKVALRESVAKYTYLESVERDWTEVTPGLVLTKLLDRPFGRPGVLPESFALEAYGFQIFAGSGDTKSLFRLRAIGVQSFISEGLPPTGTWRLFASGAQSWTGTAELIQETILQAIGAQGFSGSALGRVTLSLAASGSQSWTGSASQKGTFRLQAAGAQSLTGSASRITSIQLAAAGDQNWTGSAIQKGTWKIAASGSQDWTSSAAQIGRWKLQGAGSQNWTGSAIQTGTWKIQASGDQTWTGSAVGTIGGGAFDVDYQAVLTLATAQGYTLPSSGVQTAQNQLVIDLKASGAWALIDTLCVLKGGTDPDFALINFKDPTLSKVGTRINSPTFGSHGYTGTTTNFVEAPALFNGTGNYKLNEAHVLVYSVGRAPAATADVQGYDPGAPVAIYMRNWFRNTVPALWRNFMNDNLNSGAGAVGGDLTLVNRTLSTQFHQYINGNLENTITRTTNQLPPGNVLQFARTTNPISVIATGGNVDSVAAGYMTAVQTYINAL